MTLTQGLSKRDVDSTTGRPRTRPQKKTLDPDWCDFDEGRSDDNAFCVSVPTAPAGGADGEAAR